MIFYLFIYLLTLLIYRFPISLCGHTQLIVFELGFLIAVVIIICGRISLPFDREMAAVMNK